MRGPGGDGDHMGRAPDGAAAHGRGRRPRVFRPRRETLWGSVAVQGVGGWGRAGSTLALRDANRTTGKTVGRDLHESVVQQV